MPAIKKVSDATGVPASHWRVYEDGNQSSTIAAGKSCCTFLAAVFNSLEQAFAVTVSLRRELPRVNLELFITPDGRRDQGDGVASYDHLGAEFKKRGSYLSPADFGVSVLVDLQNVNRELARNRNYSPGF